MPYQPYAREVKRKPNEGGVIALKSEHRPEDRQRADSMMASNCGSNSIVKVSEEGEVAVGEKTKSNSNKVQDNGSVGSGFSLGGLHFGSANPRPGENTDTTTETVQVKEWQIAYNCVAINAPEAIAPSKKGISRK
jgi:hypothetical protein